MKLDHIIVKGAKEHNLKNIDVSIPKNKLIVITGPSGSGKSSLAFNTLYAEGERRYIENLALYAKHFLHLPDRPNVDAIYNLPPAIAIKQRTITKNSRSTVGTITEIYDYMKLLFARIGVPTSPITGLPIKKQTVSDMIDQIINLPLGTHIYILAPLTHNTELPKLKSKGFEKIIFDNNIININEINEFQNKADVLISHLVISPYCKDQVAESIELGLKTFNGIIYAQIIKLEENNSKYKINNKIILSEKYICPVSGFEFPEIELNMFSFNNPSWACNKCKGLGKEMVFSKDLIVPDKNQSINQGALSPWDLRSSKFLHIISTLAKHYDFSLNQPFNTIPEDIQNIIFFGSNDEKIDFTSENQFNITNKRTFGGLIKSLENKYQKDPTLQSELNKYLIEQICISCMGHRLKPESLCVKIENINIGQLSTFSLKEVQNWLLSLIPKLTEKHKQIAEPILKEINSRLAFLCEVGVEYLSIDRESATLSGGEAQRIRLASQITNGLNGILYVLDEPSIGLHPKDTEKLINILKKLRDLGNTILVVEHDEETILSADFIIDMGPKAGINGGQIIAQGDINEIKKNNNSITGQYLTGKKSITITKKPKINNEKFIILKGAQGNNLKNIDIQIPLEKFTVVTGVSGSGKSTLILDTLYPALLKKLNPTNKAIPKKFSEIINWKEIDTIIDIDQSSIGRTPKSNPATYTGIFAHIRDWFACLTESQIRGYTNSRFSFNVRGGRCEECLGEGFLKIEMHFLPDIYVKCDVCQGQRYNKETLEIKYKEKSILDILSMTVDDAIVLFKNIPSIYDKLIVLQEVGLGYITLGQPATTLSGGEAQRVKLAKELAKKSTNKTLYILDEPTTGLHISDIKKLLEIIIKLVNLGNTVIVIEHNLDVIKTADYIIDMGPDGGNKGGNIIATGSVNQVIQTATSITGRFLKKYLEL